MITIQQTVDIPAHPKGEALRLTINVPQEVPAGRAQVIIRFPVPEASPSILEDRDTADTSTALSGNKAPVFGCARGQFQMADDFDAPLEDFREYM